MTWILGGLFLFLGGCAGEVGHFPRDDGGGQADGVEHGDGRSEGGLWGDLWGPTEGPSGGPCGDGRRAIVWAHSSDDLYRFDPVTRTVTKVGAFNGDGASMGFGMTDLAVNAQGQIYGIGRGYVYQVNPNTAAVTRVFGDGKVQGNALTFVPAGEYESGEVLVVGFSRVVAGHTVSVLAKIDLVAQTQKDIMTIADGCATSGDVVSVKKLGTYVTLRCLDAPGSDVLARLDVKQGTATRVGAIGFSAVFGLGFWCDSFYGFTDRAELIAIDPKNGSGTLITNQTGANSFWGAGVTTTAPVGPIK
ncbi:MAG: hypothetical protein KAI47_06765 [Deltaproteobacteria bacterium]|nr:hypothetical protein [Deltaproteobacteria bacterium]